MGWGSILEAFTAKQGFPGMRYRHLIQEERYQISALHDAGLTVGAIAAQLNRHASTISRELRRNRVAGPYRASWASLLAAARSQISAANARRVPAAAWEFARQKLGEMWSPEQIAGHQRVERLPRLSHEAIYQRIYADKRSGGQLHLALRHHKQRRKRRGVRERRGTIPNQVSIDQRPAIVGKRKRFGDWEADLVIGARHSQALVTINERKSRYALITRIPSKHAAKVTSAIVEQLKPCLLYTSALMNYVPNTQVLFGTDFPYVTIESNAQQLYNRRLPKQEMAAIQHENALCLMPQLA